MRIAIVGAALLALGVEAVHGLGLETAVRSIAGAPSAGESPLALLRLAGSAAAGANLVDNPPPTSPSSPRPALRPGSRRC